MSRHILSLVSSYINKYNKAQLPSSFPHIDELIRHNLIKYLRYGEYILDLDVFLHALLRKLGIKRLDLYRNGPLYCHVEKVTSRTLIGFYFVVPGSIDEKSLGLFLRGLQEAIIESNKYDALVPFIFVPEKIRRALEKNYRLIHSFSDFYFNSLKIFSLPITLPYPEIIHVPRKKRKIDLFVRFKKSITEVKDILKSVQVGFEDEYTFLLNFRKKFWSKILVSFAQLDHILRKYAVVKMRSKWKGPSKWFEEFMKILLIDIFVRNRFNEEVERFLLNYRTGGRKADIIIPVRVGNNEAVIWIVDTKHWEKDFCRSVWRSHEKTIKYIAYVDKNSKKSRQVWKLIELLENAGIEDVRFHLVFLQRKSKACKLDAPELRKYYEEVKVLGLKDVLRLL